MKTCTPFTRVWLVLTSLFAFAASARAQSATGTIEGRVFNTTTGDYIEHARITVEGTSIETLTDSGGQYRLIHVPAGEARVRVFFTGFEPQIENVPVSAGTAVHRDINLGTGPGPRGAEVVKLQEVVVSSSKQMSGAAIAINEQRFASNMVNVVSADEFGAVLENNVGDFLKFLPGMSLTFIGGAAQSISMGGVPPDYVPITIGGFDLATVSGGGTARSVDFHTISMNNMGRIEAVHSPTPESPGSALAGSVNMVPRSSFDYSRPQFNYDAFFMMRDNDRHMFSKTPGPRWVRTRKVHPGFDFSYINPVNDHFGFTLTGADTKQYTEEERSANTWIGGGTASNGNALPDTSPDKPYLSSYVVEDGGKHTQRRSLGATVDYKFSPYDRVSLAFELAQYDSPLNQRNVTFNVNRVTAGNFAPTFTHGASGAGSIQTASQSRHHSRLKYMPMLTYRHNGPIWKAEAAGALSHEELTFRSIDKGYMNQVISVRNNVTVNFDDNFYLRPGRITVFDGTTGAPVDPYNLSNYTLSTGNGAASRTQDVRRTAYANLARGFDLAGAPLTLKGGVDFRQAIRDNRGSTTTPAYTFAPENASLLLDEVFSERTAPYGFPKIQYTSTQEAYNYYQANPGKITVNQVSAYTGEVNRSTYARELVSSAYLRGDLALFQRRLKLVGGVRAEQTNVDAEGPLNDPTRNFQRDASGKILRAANGTTALLINPAGSLAATQLTNIDRGTQVSKEYLRLFPSLNASYNITENLIARAAFYTSIGRPNFTQYAGPVTLPDPDDNSPNARIVVNNAAIKPWKAETEKVRLEYYFAGVGQVSVGAFRREYKNFFGSTTFTPTAEFLDLYSIDPATYGRFPVTTQYNLTNTVRSSGVEFDYKQVLKFLPHWARGVQVFANATAQRVTGDDTADFSGYVPRVYNGGISLNREKFNIRFNWNYRGLSRGAPVTGRGIEPGTFNWTSKVLFRDIQGEYYLLKRFAVFFALRNVGDQTTDTKIYGPDTPEVARFRQRTTYGSLWSFGIKGSF